MIQHTTINGRPAAVLFVDASFEPTNEANAAWARVVFKDDGGSMFLVIDAPGTSARYYGEKPGERDEAGKFGPGGGGAGSAASSSGSTGPSSYSMDDFRKAEFYYSVGGAGSNEERAFLKTWNERIAMSPQDFRSRMMGGRSGSFGIAYRDSDKSLAYSSTVRDPATKADIGSFSGRLELIDKVAVIDNMRFEDEYQGKGHAKELFVHQSALVQELGIEQIQFCAGSTMGGYAWAKYGGVPDRDSWDTMRSRMEMLVDKIPGLPAWERGILLTTLDDDNPKAIWRVADNRYGKDLLAGRVWDGAFSLKDHDTMKRYMAYMAKPRKAA